jgi:hypothetical protein
MTRVTNKRPHPKTGDVILGCTHEPDVSSAHVFQIKKGLPFTRLDGTRATASWVFICDACFQKYVVLGGGLATDAPLGCDRVWEEGERIRYRDPS